MTDLPTMVPTPKSGNVDSVGYADGKLYVKFRSGPQVYCYDGVPPDVHSQMMSVGSVGSYIHAHIKDKYTTSVVGETKSGDGGTTDGTVAPDSPLMVAWKAYSSTPAYAASKAWALHAEHTEGSMWAAFAAGWLGAAAVVDACKDDRGLVAAVADRLRVGTESPVPGP